METDALPGHGCSLAVVCGRQLCRRLDARLAHYSAHAGETELADQQFRLPAHNCTAYCKSVGSLTEAIDAVGHHFWDRCRDTLPTKGWTDERQHLFGEAKLQINELDYPGNIEKHCDTRKKVGHSERKEGSVKSQEVSSNRRRKNNDVRGELHQLFNFTGARIKADNL